jgi:hypothetical protein
MFRVLLGSIAEDVMQSALVLFWPCANKREYARRLRMFSR